MWRLPGGGAQNQGGSGLGSGVDQGRCDQARLEQGSRRDSALKRLIVLRIFPALAVGRRAFGQGLAKACASGIADAMGRWRRGPFSRACDGCGDPQRALLWWDEPCHLLTIPLTDAAKTAGQNVPQRLSGGLSRGVVFYENRIISERSAAITTPG